MCSAVHPMAVCSPVLETFPLEKFGLEWIHSSAPLVHPLDDGSAAILERRIDVTASQFGMDQSVYVRLMSPIVAHWKDLVTEILAPLHLPSHPLRFAHFGFLALRSATNTRRRLFRDRVLRSVFAGVAAHSCIPLEWLGSSATAWMLLAAVHAVGWPIPRGGAGQISHALATYFSQIITSHPVRSLDQLPCSIVLCDVAPRQLLRIAAGRLPERFTSKLLNYKYGPGVFKIDWALDRPIPWTAAACSRAATVHLGGSFQEIAESERAVWNGGISPMPFVILAQPSLFDGMRAPAGKHTAWAYCYVPNGSEVDMVALIERQVERFAPGFRSTVLARQSQGPAQLQEHNANLVGRDINGGALNFGQLFLRPTRTTYRTPIEGVYLCSASTPPGSGVHGMCGYHAARAAMIDAGVKWPK
jgi:phytoene dehydrogenase-like protein